ncbi:MAG: tRNA (adenosine(37)-N6)-threonylcarbamoyltransferase complex transferase subunit TsaD [Candidatus Peribacteraceae bacterium]|nr:tRNA (adenosine(37)-N6)-threonylcarbamoyltransferase complex transferase subunit TsaD [Candidatus Peribacteraceae bacterium]
MRILALETSCDETAAAIVEEGTHVLGSVIASSREVFARAGGVIPEEAARMQVTCIHPVLDQVFSQAGITEKDIDLLAVTRGPGLLGSLLVGTTTARMLASLWKKPLLGIHHTLGHLSSPWLSCTETPRFPLLTLSASGGHTELWYRTDHLHGEILGSTRDDAAGEAFDKGASLLGLPYPGGPSLARAAEQGDPHAFPFPLPLAGDSTLDFSFSGLKTALKYTLRDLGTDGAAPERKADLAASYQHALCRHLIQRITQALARCPDAQEVHLVGGVSANQHLRSLVQDVCDGRTLRTPLRLEFCTDNAAMIAAAAFFASREQQEKPGLPFTTAASLPSSAALSPA